MTLKELRIAKGLSQKECAEVLGMSTRNYQNYENRPEMEKTAKYHAVYKKLEMSGENPVFYKMPNFSLGFQTNVKSGKALQSLTRDVSKYQKRDCFETLGKYIADEHCGKIAVLYGLRRTGKTTLLFQMIRELPAEQTAYIKITAADNMSKLSKDLELLCEENVKYVFIDEITLMEDFIDTASLLSDIFSMMGMKIVVSGTDSLGFDMADRNELYDRTLMIHTSFIPFREYFRLLGIRSLDTYIEYGGTLKMENMDYDDPEYSLEDVSFRDDESTRKYIDSSIARNIQHSLKNNRYTNTFDQLCELYEKNELTSVISRTIESMNHRFVLSVVNEKFRSHIPGSARELLLHEYPAATAHVLYNVDEETLLRRLKEIIEIKEKNELSVEITQIQLEKIKTYLQRLDLIKDCTEKYESKGQSEYTIFTQPGMRYSIARALVYSLMKDTAFSSLAESDKNHIIEKILEDVKGRMMEDIILLETDMASRRNEEVFRFKFDEAGEFDMVVFNRESLSCRLYEVKHSSRMDEHQTKFLKEEEKLSLIEKRFGTIEGRYVIYRGKPGLLGDIRYLNAEEYLCSL